MTSTPDLGQPGRSADQIDAFTGVVLAGGRASRMGTDKAFVPIGGAPLVGRVLEALRAAAAAEVLVVGGDVDGFARLGYAVVADRWPGEGPLGGLITALLAARHDRVVVLPCDHPDVTEATVHRLCGALGAQPHRLAAVARFGPRWQPLVGVYRRAALTPLLRAFDAGERSPTRAVSSLDVLAVTDLPAEVAVDLDSPDDVRRYAAGGSGRPA